MSRKFLRISLPVIACAIMLTSALAWARPAAGSMHFVGAPTADFNSGTNLVTVSGKVAGLGNGNITVTTEVDGEIIILLINPGSSLPPGQNKQPLNETDEQVFTPSPKNGQFTFTINVSLDDAVQSAINAVKLPNKNWVKEVGSVDVNSITVTITQGGQSITQTFNL
jgi:hypothetical protein